MIPAKKQTKYIRKKMLQHVFFQKEFLFIDVSQHGDYHVFWKVC